MTHNIHSSDFIEVVKSYALLYNTDHDDYKNQTKTKEAWETIASEFGLRNGDEARVKWRNLRDSYLKYLRKKQLLNGRCPPGIKKQKWTYDHSMKFLLPYLTVLEKKSTNLHRKNTTATVSIKNEETAELHQDQEFVDESFTLELDPLVAEVSENSFTPPEGGSASFKEPQRAGPDSDVDLFFKSLAESVKKLPQIKQSQIKLQCSQIVFEAEMEREINQSE